MKPFIGIKRIWYGNVFAAAVTPATLKTWLASAKEVKNSHQDTWGYTQDDSTITDYINELTGKPYYRDATALGAKTIAFTMGMYAFADKAALQGGTVIKEGTAPNEVEVGWSAPDVADIISKGIVAQTKTGNYVVFTNASVIGKVNFVEKNIGLGVTAVAMENETANVKDEYWFDGVAVDTEG
ncbi:hypothetical protein [Bacteroides reticulotermitis]|uniref:hypothetical protein n=1 Tax=Bacteroides reticulotermitis TaxID=1133319 RepID=UPI003A871B61